MQFKKFLTIFILNFIATYAFASTWPLFSSPDKEFLLMQRYLETSSCKKGEGKLLSDRTIQIENFCKTYCPNNWEWKITSDNNCHNLQTDFTFLHYDFNYFYNADSTVNHTVITAYYGQVNIPFFSFTFTTPDNYWYCFEADKNSHTIVCGNDI